jgi:hypothetical protein
MTKFIHRIHNLETGEVIDKEYTADEIKAVQAAIAESQVEEEQRQKVEADKAKILAKIGLTADEAKLLLS